MDYSRKIYILQALTAHIGKGKKETQQSVALKLNVDQGRISRILNGEFVRDKGVVKQLYQLIGFDPDLYVQNDAPQITHILIDAVNRNWDGSDEHAIHLAKIFDEIGKIGHLKIAKLTQKKSLRKST